MGEGDWWCHTFQYIVVIMIQEHSLMSEGVLDTSLIPTRVDSQNEVDCSSLIHHTVWISPPLSLNLFRLSNELLGRHSIGYIGLRYIQKTFFNYMEYIS